MTTVAKNATTENTSITPSGIMEKISELQEKAKQGSIEQYFPGNPRNKEQILDEWKKQLQRLADYADLLFTEIPPQQIEPHQEDDLQVHLKDAEHTLDFTRAYTVKLIGHTGFGKTTLLAAMTGRDIFPRGSGGAVTGVSTQIYICREGEPEGMRVHFLSRAAFDDLISQTEKNVQAETDTTKRERLEEELAILRATKAHFANQLQEEAYTRTFPPERWEEQIKTYVEEPTEESDQRSTGPLPENDQKSKRPRITRLIDYVEFRIGPKNTLLPPGSVLVDLPGGAAGQPNHDAILRKAMETIDAIILVTNSERGGDNAQTQHIFEEIKQKLEEKGKNSKEAARMIFVVVTRWEEIKNDASMRRINGSMHKLLAKLPANYKTYHKHGPDKNFFYPVRALDALLATLGIVGETLDDEARQQEGRDYVGDMSSVYPQLVKLDPRLSNIRIAQEFKGIQGEQHEAMRVLSGLPELNEDLQEFLSESRFEVQLHDAKTQINTIQQQLESIAWEHLENLGIQISNRNLGRLRQEIEHRGEKRTFEYGAELERRKELMLAAWDTALREYKKDLRSEKNAFLEALTQAHQGAIDYVYGLIDEGYFDHHMMGKSEKELMSLEDVWIDVAVRNLIENLRLIFSVSIEKEINRPAHALAQLFLKHIKQKEADGSLDIANITENAESESLARLRNDYKEIKNAIEDTASRICLYVTMSELVNGKHKLLREDPSVKAIYDIADEYKEEDPEFLPNARKGMKQLLNGILEYTPQNAQGQKPEQVAKQMGLVNDTRPRIALLFHYELAKLVDYYVYEVSRKDMVATKPGKFADLTEGIRSEMAMLLSNPNSAALQKRFEELLYPHEESIQFWFDLLQKIEGIEEGVARGSKVQANGHNISDQDTLGALDVQMVDTAAKLSQEEVPAVIEARIDLDLG